MPSDAQLKGHEPGVIEQGERLLAEQAAITLDEASNRIRLYARFRDLRLVDVCKAVLDDTVRLLTVRENDDLTRRTADLDREARPG
jgi:hypothetical protein